MKNRRLITHAHVFGLIIVFSGLGLNCAIVGSDDGTSNESPRVSPTEYKGVFKFEYPGVAKSKFEHRDMLFRESRTFEKLVEELNGILLIPWDITFRATDCGDVNAIYKPADRSITLCYEIFDYIYKRFSKSGASPEIVKQKSLDTTRFIFFHELAHALMHAYKVDSRGDEELVADEFSTYLCIDRMGESGTDSVVAAAEFFATGSPFEEIDLTMYARRHRMNRERFFDTVCLLYGSDSNKYAYLTEKKILSRKARGKCSDRWKIAKKNWDAIFKRWDKNENSPNSQGDLKKESNYRRKNDSE